MIQAFYFVKTEYFFHRKRSVHARFFFNLPNGLSINLQCWILHLFIFADASFFKTIILLWENYWMDAILYFPKALIGKLKRKTKKAEGITGMPESKNDPLESFIKILK